MNLLSLLLSGAASAAVLFSPLAATAQGTAPSPFEAVAQHLDTGGVFYTVVDLGGDAARLAGIGDALIGLARKEAGEAIPPGLSALGLVKALGLDRVQAVGMSSRKSEGTLFHNRAIVYMPEGRAGLFKLFGGAAAPLQSPSFAPAGSDVVMESDVTLGALLEVVEAVLQSTGEPRWLQQYQGLLGFPVPGLDLTAGDFIAKLNTRILVAGRLETGRTFTPPGSPLALPAFRLVISFDQLDFLFPAMLEYARHTGKTTVEKGEGFELLRPANALPGELAYFQPVLYHDLKSKRILLGTHREAITECLEGNRPLSADAGFIKATAGLSKAGNEFSYLTPAVFQTIQKLVQAAMASDRGAASGPRAGVMEEMMEQLQLLSPLPDQPLAGVRANLPEGMVFQSNSNQSFKALLPAMIVFPVAVISAVGFSTYAKAMPSLRQAGGAGQKRAETADADADPAVDGVRHNLQQIAFAAQSYFVDQPDASEVSFEQLIKAELLFRPDAVSGESYKGLVLKKTGGSLAVKLSSGRTVSLKYGPVTD